MALISVWRPTSRTAWVACGRGGAGRRDGGTVIRPAVSITLRRPRSRPAGPATRPDRRGPPGGGGRPPNRPGGGGGGRGGGRATRARRPFRGGGPGGPAGYPRGGPPGRGS